MPVFLLLAGIAEIALLVWVGSRLGLGATFLLVALTSVLGGIVVKRQGLAMWRSARLRLAHGSMPGGELIHGAMILVAGGLLLLPGFLSDLAGAGLLIPAVRRRLRTAAGSRLVERFSRRRLHRVEVWRV